MKSALFAAVCAWIFVRLLNPGVQQAVFFDLPQKVGGRENIPLSSAAEIFAAAVGVILYLILRSRRYGWTAFVLLWAWCVTEILLVLLALAIPFFG